VTKIRQQTFITGTDSPVNIDSSTIQGPRNNSRSHGTSFSSCDRPSYIHNDAHYRVTGTSYTSCKRPSYIYNDALYIIRLPRPPQNYLATAHASDSWFM